MGRIPFYHEQGISENTKWSTWTEETKATSKRGWRCMKGRTTEKRYWAWKQTLKRKRGKRKKGKRRETTERKRRTTKMRGGRKKESRNCPTCSRAGSEKKTRGGETTSNEISTGLIKRFNRCQRTWWRRRRAIKRNKTRETWWNWF